ncbi:MAG: hypothetical protein JWR33_2510 [Naasia sp.]|uniref:FUSC family protein n=1 Tax=Naasia sp. TaxID=2546198 RepID=UPI00260ECF51|nr:FUSC family protein [Naasia sp.]MCU1571769.1 hypothetical protein [Naasia sp.]
MRQDWTAFGARARVAFDRAGASLPAILQIAGAATVGYVLAKYVLGHPTPIFASTVAITALGFARDARPSRVAETALGITLGILLSDLLLLGIGRGWWQLFLVLAATLVAARVLSSSPGFAAAAGVQATLVTLFPVAGGGEFSRVLDGLVGGVVALLFTALVPRDPMREAVREAHRVFAACTDATADLAAALRSADEPLASRSLEALRRTQPLVDAWSGSLDSAVAIARVSPFLRRHRATLQGQRRLLRGMDLACRNLRIIARRIDFLVRDARPRPELAALLGEVSSAIAVLAAAVDDPSSGEGARDRLVVLARRLAPEVALPEAGITESMVLLLLRPLVVDLLAAAGFDEADARALLPALPD